MHTQRKRERERERCIVLSPGIFLIAFAYAAREPEVGYMRGRLSGGLRLIARSITESSRLSRPQYEDSSFAQATPFSRARLSGLTAPSSNRFSSCVSDDPWSPSLVFPAHLETNESCISNYFISLSWDLRKGIGEPSVYFNLQKYLFLSQGFPEILSNALQLRTTKYTLCFLISAKNFKR